MGGPGFHLPCYKLKPSFLRASALSVQMLLRALDLHLQVCIWPCSWIDDALTQRWAEVIGRDHEVLSGCRGPEHSPWSQQPAWAWSPFHSPLPQNCSRHACRSCHAPGFLGNYEMRFSQDSALANGVGGGGGDEAWKNL